MQEILPHEEIAFKFDALADPKELQIRKSSDLPNDHLRIRFELQIESEAATEHSLTYSESAPHFCRDEKKRLIYNSHYISNLC